MVVPEFFQKECHAVAVEQAMHEILDIKNSAGKDQKQAFQTLLNLLEIENTD